jgi:ribosomal protein L44E
MTQHFTRNTVSAEFYCGKCEKFTQHRISGGRKGPCLDCVARLEKAHAAKPKPEAEKQQELFHV